eukprot:scaffold10967_cov81-Phaeocystis_antarctica.AAC.1
MSYGQVTLHRYSARVPKVQMPIGYVWRSASPTAPHLRSVPRVRTQVESREKLTLNPTCRPLLTYSTPSNISSFARAGARSRHKVLLHKAARQRARRF